VPNHRLGTVLTQRQCLPDEIPVIEASYVLYAFPGLSRWYEAECSGMCLGECGHKGLVPIVEEQETSKKVVQLPDYEVEDQME